MQLCCCCKQARWPWSATCRIPIRLSSTCTESPTTWIGVKLWIHYAWSSRKFRTGFAGRRDFSVSEFSLLSDFRVVGISLICCLFTLAWQLHQRAAILPSSAVTQGLGNDCKAGKLGTFPLNYVPRGEGSTSNVRIAFNLPKVLQRREPHIYSWPKCPPPPPPPPKGLFKYVFLFTVKKTKQWGHMTINY